MTSYFKPRISYLQQVISFHHSQLRRQSLSSPDREKIEIVLNAARRLHNIYKYIITYGLTFHLLGEHFAKGQPQVMEVPVEPAGDLEILKNYLEHLVELCQDREAEHENVRSANSKARGIINDLKVLHQMGMSDLEDALNYVDQGRRLHEQEHRLAI
jgi:hypothetical protein